MKKRPFLKWALLGALSLAPVSVLFGQEDALPVSGVIPDRYIVVLKPGADHGRVASRHGLAPDLAYSHALNGFAGHVPPGQLRLLQSDPDVVWIESDQVVTIVGVSGKGGKTPPPPAAQVIPTGVQRIGAAPSGVEDFSAVGIAIIDTGIDLTHPDLNVKGNVTFVRATRSGNDDNGHGTHCAGIAAAINNTIGVVGVAPNASLYAVKVLDRNGNGTYSAVIAGVDWVTANAGSLGIRVANMSLGGPDSPTLKTAIANSVAAGVVYCVAAGNDSADAKDFSPANCPEAVAVSAIDDRDGLCGNDVFASFSNFGSFVHIAAPGVNIYSTYKGGGYATMSGTSMAAPHVTGAAAKYIAHNPASAADVYGALIAAGTAQTDFCGFTRDKDIIPEPLVNAAGL